MLAGHGVDPLHGGQDAELFTASTYGQILLLHVALGLQHEASNLEVTESKNLSLTHGRFVNLFQAAESYQLMLEINDILQFAEEPGINLGQLVDAVDADALLQSLCYGKDTQVGGVSQLVLYILKLQSFVTYKAVHTLAYHTEALLDNFLKRTADGHDLTHRLHARTNLAAHADKLGEVPARNLANQVVELRSHVGRVGRAHFTNLVERIAQRNLGSHKSQRIASSLGCQCRRTRQTGIHLNHAVVVGLGVEGILDVAFTHDVQMTDALDGELLQHLHLLVGERTGRSHYDALTGVNTQRVEVLHAGHGEAVVVGVADDLELNLFPALERLLYQNLLGEGEGTLSQLEESIFVRTDAAAQSTQGIG